ncbi:MAG: carbon starvation protein A [Gemmataceae bacterium]
MAGSALLVTLGCFGVLVLAYRWYGKFLAQRIFQLDPDRETPAHTMRDGVDYVPTKVPVLFGHHFASIAGLGPILGPALAVIWGWVPAVLWVIVGCIFMGAVHDLGALTVSMRFRGRSIGDVCQELIGQRARLLFLVIIFFAMSLAMGVFALTVSGLFISFNPDAIIPSFGLMVVAVLIGIATYKFKMQLVPATVLGLVAFGGLIVWGGVQPIPTHEWFVSAETKNVLDEGKDSGKLERPYAAGAAADYLKVTGNKEAEQDLAGAVETTRYAWIGVLLVYAFLASVLPVWLLLQPRDYINSFQLYVALSFLFLGLIAATIFGDASSVIQAEAFRTPGEDFSMGDAGYRPIIPFLFVTIACGAVSGFHSLVASGTTAKQVDKETDALPIGYGGMLTEGALAILVIMACVAGLGASAWAVDGRYSTWLGGLAPKLESVIAGGAAYLNMLGVPVAFARTFLAVTIIAFALTTLDSGTRLLRFNLEEIARSVKLDFLTNRYTASVLAIAGVAMFALLPVGRVLWTLFGTTNQLLASLTLLTVSVFLFKLKRPVVYTLVPMALMLSVTVWAMIINIQGFWEKEQWFLLTVAITMLGISVWMLAEALMAFGHERGMLFPEPPKESLSATSPQDQSLQEAVTADQDEIAAK